MILSDAYGRRICEVQIVAEGRGRIACHACPPAFLFKRFQRSPGQYFPYRVNRRRITATITFLSSSTIIFQLGDQP